MTATVPDAQLETRKTVFRVLVEAQDEGFPVRASRGIVAKRFGLTDKQLKDIELEGVDHEWPPL